MHISEENGRFLKTLLALAPPIVAQEILNTSINLLDTIMVGKALGSSEIAAVGIANQVFFLFTIILFGVNSGSAIFVGQYWGKEDKPSIWKTMGVAFTFNTVLSGIFVGIALFAPRAVMNIYSRDPEVIEHGIAYLRIVGFSYFLTALILTRNSAVRATGYTKLAMITTFSSLITNFSFNYLTIFILDMGVAGAALSTLIARVVETALQEILIRRLKLPVLASFKAYFSYNLPFVKEFFKVTSYVILNESVWAIGVSVYNIAYSFCGTESQAAYQIGVSIMQIFQVFGMAIGTACAIMLSNALGAGEVSRAVKYSRKCIKMSLAISLFMTALLITASPFIINFYSIEPEVAELTRKLMYVIAFAVPIKTVNFTTICGILRSGGDTKFCFLADGLSVWLLGVPLGFLGALVFKLPIYWVVLMTYSEEVGKLVFALKRALSNVWARRIV